MRKFGITLALFVLGCLLAPRLMQAQNDCPTPLLIAANPGEKFVEIQWIGLGGGSSFEIQWSDDGGQTWDEETVTAQPPPPFTAMIDGLDPDTEYLVRMRAICGRDNFSEFTENREFRTRREGQQDPCPAVNFFDVQTVGSSSATLFWFGPPGITAYIVEYSDDGGQTFVSEPPTTDNFYQLTGLDPETDYIVRLRSVCGEDASNVSEDFQEIEITTLPEGADSCPEPEDISVSDIGNSFAQIDWSRPAQGDEDGLTYYQAFYAPLTGGPTQTLEFVPETSAEVNNLTPGTDYIMCLRSACQKDFGEVFSDTACFTFTTEGDPDEPFCPRPGRPEVFEVSDDFAYIFWNRVQGGVRYIVEISADGGDTWEVAGETQRFNTELEIEGLEPQTQYLVRVIAICRNGGESEPSSETSFTTTPDSDECPAPFDLLVEDITSTTAFIDWESEENQFTVGWEVEVINQFTGESIFDFTNQTELELDGLRPGQPYIVRVRTLCEFGEFGEVYSDDATTEFRTTEGNPDCPTPQQIFALSVSGTTANLLWSAVGPAERYFVEFRPAGETEWTSVNVEDTNFVRLTDLEPDTFYEVRVRAVCAEGERSDFSPSGEFETLGAGATECPKPEIVEIDAEGFSAEFDWEVPEPNNVIYYQYWVTTNLNDFGDGKVAERSEGDWENLIPNTTYFLIVRSICRAPNSGEEYPSDLTIQEFQTEDAEIECDAPEIEELEAIPPNRLFISWSESENAQYYLVQSRLKGEDEWNEFEYQFTELDAEVGELNTKYEIRICAVCVPGAEDGVACSEIEEFIVETDPNFCPGPERLRINRIREETARLRWDYFTDNPIAGFEVKVFNQDGQEVLTEITQQTRYDIEGLEPCTDYFVEVRALCISENSNQPNPSEPLVEEFRTEGDCSTECPAPDDLVVEEVGENFASISWEPTGDNQFFYLVTLNNSEFEALQPFFAFEDLEPCREYVATVTAFCGDEGQISEPVDIFFTTECRTECPPVKALEVGEITPNRAVAFWEPVEQAVGYEVTVEGGNGGPPFSFFVLDPPAELAELQAQSNYVVTVRTVCEDSVLSAPTFEDFTTPFEDLPCPEVDFLADSTFPNGGVAFFWSAPELPNIEGFEYQLTRGRQLVDQGFTDSFEKFYETLEPGEYAFRVRVVCISPNGEEKFSEYEDITIVIESPCKRPNTPEITSLNPIAVNISWTEESNATSYEIRYRRSGANEQWVTIPGIVTSSSVVSGLIPEEDYVVCVRAFCGEGLVSDWSECKEFTTGELTCDAPEMPEAFDINYNAATISWNDAPGAAEYKLEFSADDGVTWNSVIVAENEFRLENLQQESLYLIRVSTICENGLTSAPSDLNEFVTPAKPPLDCPPPLNLSVTDVTRETAFADWDAPQSPNITGYRYQYTSASFTSPMRFTPRTEAELIELMEGTNYEIVVQSVCVDEETNQEYFSDQVSDTFRTVGDPPNCPSPARPGIRDITQDFAVAFWESVPGAIAYEVEYSSDGGETWSSLTTQETGAPLNGLSPDTRYIVRVKTICEGERVSAPSPQEDFRTLPVETECPAPQNVRVSEVTTSTAQVAWNDAPGAVRYEVYFDLTPGNFIQFNAPDNEAELFGLQPGREYQVYVITVCEGGEKSERSETITFITPELGECAAPQRVEVSSVGNSSALVEWTAVPGASAYRVSFRERGQGQFNTVSVSNRNNLDLTGLVSGTEYEVKVQSVCSGGRESDFTDEVIFTTTDLENCNPPSLVIVSDVLSNRAEISWGAVQGAQGYQMTYRKQGETESVTLPVTQSTSQTLTGLEPGATYEVTVRTLCTGETGTGFSDPSNPEVFTTQQDDSCPAPFITSIDDAQETTAKISWQGSDKALGYQVAISADSGKTYMEFLAINTSFEFENLNPGVKYFVKVRALCPGGVLSEYSPEDDFNTLKEGGCYPPENIAIENLTHELVSASWDPVPGVTNYEARLILKVTRDTINISTVGRTSVQFAGLLPDAEYEITVRALCPNGEYSEFGKVEFRTETIPPCVAPEEVVVDEILANSARATWSSVRGARGYQVNLSFDGGVSFIAIFPFLQDTTVDLTNLVSDSTYVLQVVTICFEGGLSVPSANEAFETLPENDCVSPRNVIVTQIGQDSAVVSWDASGGATFYEVEYRSQSSGLYTTLPLTAQTSIVIDQLMPGGAYAARVRAICEIDNRTTLSSFSPDISFETQPTGEPCNTPRDLEFDDITENSATVTWSAVAGAVAYEVSYSNNQGQTFVTLPLTTNTTVDLTNLFSDVNYRVRVRSVCGANNASAPAIKSFETDTDNDCATPTGLTVKFINANDATVSWNPVPGAISYQVSYKTVLGSFFITINETNTSRRLIGLDAGAEYIVKVRARCAQGENPFTPWTTNFVFQTKSGASSCPAPSNFDVSADDPTTATATWSATPGAFRYRVSYSFDGGATFINLPWTTSTSQTLAGLTPGDTYLARVRAECTRISSQNTGALQFTMPTQRAGSGEGALGNFTVYPNPADGYVNVKFAASEAGAVDIRLVDMTGRAVYRSSATSTQGLNEIPLNLETVSSGVYQLQVVSEGRSYNAKLVVQ